MDAILFNTRAPAKRVIRNGKEYLVAPLSLIVPGVLPGSQGPLLYTAEDCANNVQNWNGVPLVAYHPTSLDGRAISASEQGVWERQGLGRVYASNFKGKLRAEGWFDAKKTRQVDNRIYTALVSGAPMELSTGLYTQNEPAKNGANHNGKPYSHIARNYGPDHVAILPDQRGACSLNDGCGLNVNVENEANFVSEDQRRYLWSQEPDIAEAWAHGEHTAEGNHKMPGGPGPDVKGPAAEKARERAAKRKKKADNMLTTNDLEDCEEDCEDDEDCIDECLENNTYRDIIGSSTSLQRQLSALVGNRTLGNLLYNEQERDELGRFAPSGATAGEKLQSIREAGTKGRITHDEAAGHIAAVMKEHGAKAFKEGAASIGSRSNPTVKGVTGVIHRHMGAADRGRSIEAAAGIQNAIRIVNAWSEEAREAAAAARAASSKARTLESKDEDAGQAHQEAHTAHKEAAAVARKGGDEKTAAEHDTHAERHGTIARQSGFGTQRGFGVNVINGPLGPDTEDGQEATEEPDTEPGKGQPASKDSAGKFAAAGKQPKPQQAVAADSAEAQSRYQQQGSTPTRNAQGRHQESGQFLNEGHKPGGKQVSKAATTGYQDSNVPFEEADEPESEAEDLTCDPDTDLRHVKKVERTTPLQNANIDLGALLAYNRDWPQDKRDKLPSNDFAGPGQSFPIANQKDVNNAVKLVIHADDPEAVGGRIKSIARRKGLKLPPSWMQDQEENCGPGMNSNQGRSDMTSREQALKVLTSNCHCEQDRAALNVMSDAMLYKLAVNAPNFSGMSKDSKTQSSMEQREDVEEGGGDAEEGTDVEGGTNKNAIDEKTSKAAPGASKAPMKAQGVSLNAWLAKQPEDVQRMVKNAMAHEERQKGLIINHLTKHLGDRARVQAVNALQGKNLEELQFMSSLLPAERSLPSSQPASYLGASAGSFSMTDNLDDGHDDTLEPPTINYAELAAEQRGKKVSVSA